MFTAPPQTPQRALPGAYVQTPGPKLNYQSSYAAQQSMQPASGATQQQSGSQSQAQALTQQRQQEGQGASRQRAEDLRPVERGSRTINQTLEQDSRYPALDTYVSRERCEATLHHLQY